MMKSNPIAMICINLSYSFILGMLITLSACKTDINRKSVCGNTFFYYELRPKEVLSVNICDDCLKDFSGWKQYDLSKQSDDFQLWIDKYEDTVYYYDYCKDVVISNLNKKKITYVPYKGSIEIFKKVSGNKIFYDVKINNGRFSFENQIYKLKKMSFKEVGR